MARKRNPEGIHFRRLDDGALEVIEHGEPVGQVFRTMAFNQDGTPSRSPHWAWRLYETGDSDGGGESGRQAARLMLNHRDRHVRRGGETA